MKMNQNIYDLETYTIEEFQDNFDFLFQRVENGESFMIKSEHGDAVIVPYKEVVKVFEDADVDDEIIRLHTDHEEGS